MEEAIIRELACASTRALCHIARDLADGSDNARNVAISPKLTDFAARLHTVAEELDQPRPSQRALSAQRVTQYLVDVEKLCTAHKRNGVVTASASPLPLPSPSPSPSPLPSQFPRLLALSQNKIGRKELAPLLRSFVRSVHARDTFYKNLSRLIPRRDAVPPTAPPGAGAEEDVPARVQNEVYHALRARRMCECRARKCHPAELDAHVGYLRLVRGCPDHGDDSVFDTVFQASCRQSQERPGMWSFLHILIAKQGSRGTRLQWQHPADVGPSTCEPLTSQPITTRDFCQLLLKRLGPICHQLRVVDAHMHPAGAPLMARQRLVRQPPTPLSALLPSWTLSDDGKLLLAYTVAYSFWRHYGTDLLSTRWTADHIHFLAEATLRKRPPYHDHISPIHVFVPLYFDSASIDTSPADREFVPAEGLLHWAPRVCSLGVLLADILAPEQMATVEHEHDPSHSWQEAYNNEVFECHATISQPEWPGLDIRSDIVRSTLRTLVKTCLDGSIFNTKDCDEMQRKALLYKHVIWPLQYVLELVKAVESNASWMDRNASTSAVPIPVPDPNLKHIPYEETCAVRSGDSYRYLDVQSRDSSRQHNGPTIIQNYYESYSARVTGS